MLIQNQRAQGKLETKVSLTKLIFKKNHRIDTEYLSVITNSKHDTTNYVEYDNVESKKNLSQITQNKFV